MIREDTTVPTKRRKALGLGAIATSSDPTFPEHH